MEDKLNDFRRRRRQEKIWNVLMLKGVMDKFKKSSSPVVLVDVPSSTSPEPLLGKRTLSDDNISVLSIASSTNSEWSAPSSEITRLTLITYFLYCLLWSTVLIIAIKYGFGLAYCVISGIAGIYLNTRTGPRRDGEVSAYSVFNPNCEAIDGTLKAEQFEREFNLIKHSPS